jgi:hypothetical protein
MITIYLKNLAPNVLSNKPTPMKIPEIIVMLSPNFGYHGNISILSQAFELIKMN